MPKAKCGIGPAVVVLSVVALPGVQATAGDTQAQSDAAQIQALTRRFVAGFNSGDVDSIMRFYADDYLDVNMRRPSQTKAERREYYRKILEPGDVKIDVTPDEIIVTGEYAFVRGTILLYRGQPGGQQQKSELRYIEVCRKFLDGWKAIWGIDAEIYPGD